MKIRDAHPSSEAVRPSQKRVGPRQKKAENILRVVEKSVLELRWESSIDLYKSKWMLAETEIHRTGIARWRWRWRCRWKGLDAHEEMDMRYRNKNIPVASPMETNNLWRWMQNLGNKWGKNSRWHGAKISIVDDYVHKQRKHIWSSLSLVLIVS
jgi:hypothetical protein